MARRSDAALKAKDDEDKPTFVRFTVSATHRVASGLLSSAAVSSKHAS